MLLPNPSLALQAHMIRNACSDVSGSRPITSPDFSSLVVARRRKGRPGKACDRGPRSRTRAVRRGGRRSVTQPGRVIAATQQTSDEKCGLGLAGETDLDQEATGGLVGGGDGAPMKAHDALRDRQP